VDYNCPRLKNPAISSDGMARSIVSALQEQNRKPILDNAEAGKENSPQQNATRAQLAKIGEPGIST
jgi:hypothetical protein